MIVPCWVCWVIVNFRAEFSASVPVRVKAIGVSSLVRTLTEVATGGSLTAATAMVRVAVPLEPPSLTTKVTVRVWVEGLSLKLIYLTLRNAA